MFERLRGHFSTLYDKITKSELRGKDLDKVLDEFHMTLLESDIALPAADYIRDQLKLRIEQLEFTRFSDPRGQVRGILQEILLSVLEKPGQVDFFRLVEEKKKKGEQLIVVFVGVNGTGKTTSIAKLAHLLQKKRYSVILAAGDTYRAGSIQQLEEHARRIGVKTIKHDYGADAAAVAFDAVNYARGHGVNVVLIDTAGRMQTNKNLLEEMRKIVRVTKPDLTVLVVDALTGNYALEQGKVCGEAVKIDGIILAKLHPDVKGGSSISLSYILGRPVLLVGTGQGYDDLETFQAKEIVRNMTG